jgi:hypothetical protein
MLLDRCELRSMPHRLSPFLKKLLDSYIESMLKLGGPDIQQGLIKPIKLYYQLKDTESLTPNWHNYIPSNSPKYFLSSVAKRLALTKLFRRGVRSCISKLATADIDNNNRLYSCPPLGMNTSSWKCRSIFCPNCRMRLANSTWHSLRNKYNNQDFIAIPAIILKVNIPFTQSKFGYDAPVIDKSMMRQLRNRLSKIDYFGYKTLGARIINRMPYISIQIALFSDAKNLQTIKNQITKLHKYMRRHFPQNIVSIEYKEGLDNVCLELYDAAPMCLLALFKEGFYSSFMHHTVEEYKSALAGKKKVLLFGTGV